MLEDLGLAVSFEILPWEKEDNTPPELVEVSILSPVVDASDRFVAVSIAVRATDDHSGVEYVQLEFESPSGKHEAKMYGRGEYFRGSPRDAVHRGSARVLQYSEAGTWQLKRAFVYDKLRNQRVYDAEELSALGLSASFEVVAAQQDLEPPVPVELTLDSTEVSVSDGPASIGVTVRATDDLSGVATVQLDFESPSEDVELTVGGPLHTGWTSYADGLYVGTLTVPQSSEAGDLEHQMDLCEGRSRQCGKLPFVRTTFPWPLRFLRSRGRILARGVNVTGPRVVRGRNRTADGRLGVPILCQGRQGYRNSWPGRGKRAVK